MCVTFENWYINFIVQIDQILEVLVSIAHITHDQVGLVKLEIYFFPTRKINFTQNFKDMDLDLDHFFNLEQLMTGGLRANKGRA